MVRVRPVSGALSFDRTILSSPFSNRGGGIKGGVILVCLLAALVFCNSPGHQNTNKDHGTVLQTRTLPKQSSTKSSLATFEAHGNNGTIPAPTTTASLDNKRQNHTFFYVHVGKAAGSTIGDHIRNACVRRPRDKFRNKCLQAIADSGNEMVISNRTIGLIHQTVWNPHHAMQRATAFLWSLRDPVDRLASAFYFGHVLNRHGSCQRTVARRNMEEQHVFYCTCFRTIQDLVRLLANHSLDKRVTAPVSHNEYSCLRLAQWRVRGTPNDHNHMGRNYQLYYNETVAQYPQKDIIVIRAEHLWPDLQQLEDWLGGHAVVGPDTHRSETHGSEDYLIKTKLTDPHLRQTLCCEIAADIRIYQQLIQRAVNLQEWQKQESLSELARNCRLDVCPLR